MLHDARCEVSLTPAEMPADLADATIVVIDVLRATTTIARALQSGACAVIPCEEPADALAVRERLGADRVVLGGERQSVRIPGFDIDNSPHSCTPENVEGKIVAFTTTNGTRALRRAMHAGAQAVLCGAFVNLDAVLAHVRQVNSPRVLLACAGDEGDVALEDVLLAGAIARELGESEPRIQLSDGARAASLAYAGASSDLPAAIASGKHAQALIRAGFASDIAFAAQLNVASVVPVLADGEITAAGTR